ncbi:glycosyltransferase family 4 protein [Enterovirga rhinocerotis]|uniref:Glycosyltransferase involved in cell wall biosynthesis n=1 Tax=Enterovirga rhinocerotis TaxID=1339210 RepID=A0A4R7CAF1_9HYPH|nr:glycosyltransferase family 4 protein [Enterovirga rhinocerotis]TDR93976.1 glycosyltransferase involved in cell wall biosynthesis [Enterovirga rhinocerotis]
MIPLAFYAPLKSPEDPVPSGDRTMARLLMRALRHAGFDPVLASDLRSLDIRGDGVLQAEIAGRADAETARLVASFRAEPAERRPRLWFTYHCYYKAPDLVGPRVAAALAIPYVVAEGSRAPKRAVGPWGHWHEAAEAALDRADHLFVMAPQDREALDRARPPRQTITDLPPFLDAERREFPLGAAAGSTEPDRPSGPLRLLAVAMMRPGDKLASYRLLAESLARLGTESDWSLDIVGDGPARGEVEAAFSAFGDRIRFHGAVPEPAGLVAFYRAADLLVWPAVNEAYGMVFLEAQATGCPVLAGREGGVPAVLRDGETGFLVAPRDAAAFAGRLRDLTERPAILAPMREAARRFVREERSLDGAAAILRAALGPLAAGAVREEPA